MPLEGADRHIARMRRLSDPRNRRVLGAIAFEGADIARAEAFKLVSAGSVSGAGHVPSRPGEPPNRDTGALQAGFETRQTSPVTAEFRSESAHGRPLEFGTSRMAERPHIRPARKNTLKEIEGRFRDQVQRIVRGSG